MKENKNKMHASIIKTKPKYISKILWHFTGYEKSEIKAFKTLNKILKDKILAISLKQEKVVMPSGDERIGHKCSCTCDIPLEDLAIHMIRYGEFGIGFKKENAITEGHFNPILYLHNDHFLKKKCEDLIKEIETADKSYKLKNKIQYFLTLLGSYIKSSDLNGDLYNDKKIDNAQLNNFYYEKEWRSLYEWNFKFENIKNIIVPETYIQTLKENFPDLSNRIILPPKKRNEKRKCT